MAISYNPRETLLTIGVIIVEGFAPDTYILFEPDDDTFGKKIGADGLAGRARKGSDGGTCTITLMANSESNAKLSALAAVDKESGAGVVPFLLKSGNNVLASEQCWIKRQPNVELSEEMGETEWIIDIASVPIPVLAGY